MATSSKLAFEGQSPEGVFASFHYKGGGGGHGDGIRNSSSSGGRESIDKRIGQRRILFSPNNSNHRNNTNSTPPPPPSSSLQSTKETTMTEPPSIASFAYKKRGRVDNRIERGEDLLKRSTPPPPSPPPPVNYRKGRKTAAAAAATTTTVDRNIMATSSKLAFEGQSPEGVFASFHYKGGGGGHGDGIRKRNSSSSGGRESIDKRIGQRRILFSPNNSNHSNNTNSTPPPPPSSSLQSTKETTMTEPPSIASFAYKKRGRVDNRIERGEDLLKRSTPPPPSPPPPVNYRKGRKAAAATTTVDRNIMATSSKLAFEGQSPEGVFASFHYKGGGGGHGDGIRKRNSISSGGRGSIDKRIGPGRILFSPNNNNNHSSNNNGTPPPPSLQSTKETTMTEPPSIIDGMSPAEFFASFAYKGRGRVDNRMGRGEGPPHPPPPVRKGRKTAAAAAAAAPAAVSRVTRKPAAENFNFVDTGKGKAYSGGGTTRKRPRMPDRQSCSKASEKQRQLSAKEKLSDAYRRVNDDHIWDAPRSSHNLLQERHCFDPWRVLIICILLNRTNGAQVRNVLSDFFHLCPNAKSVHEGLRGQIVDMLRSLGLQNKRAGFIIDLSECYLKDDWTHVTQLPGIGKYGADAYAIFIAGKLQQVKPKDHKLVDYWKEVSKMTIASPFKA